MIATTETEIQNLRKGGKLLGDVLRMLKSKVAVGVTTAHLDLLAEEAIRVGGGVPAFLGYKPDHAAYAYPATLCISINDEVVHGIPSEKRELREGDIVSLDLGLSYNGFFVDSAVTVPVGEVDEEATKLMQATSEATREAIKAAKIGGHVGDIGAAVEKVANKYKFSIVQDLGGHAVGGGVHEEPFVPNEGTAGTGITLVEGLVIAIEPMLAEGKGAITLGEDEWTYFMKDGKRAAHFEHTVLLTKNGPEILTA